MVPKLSRFAPLSALLPTFPAWEKQAASRAEPCHTLPGRDPANFALRGWGHPKNIGGEEGTAMTFEELRDKAHSLPLKPGVYIM